MTIPIPPPGGGPPSEPVEFDNNPFDLPQYTGATLEALEEAYEDFVRFQANFPQLEIPKITLAEFIKAVADGLLELVVAAKDVDVDFYRNRFVAQYERGKLMIPAIPSARDLEALGERHNDIYGDMDGLQIRTKWETMNDREEEYNNAIPPYNSAVEARNLALIERDQAQAEKDAAQAAYDADPNPTTEQALNDAIANLDAKQQALDQAEQDLIAPTDALNQAGLNLQLAIDDYNAAVTAYNALLNIVLQEKISINSAARVTFQIQSVLNALNAVWQNGPPPPKDLDDFFSNENVHEWAEEVEDLIDQYNSLRAAYNAAYDPDAPPISDDKLEDIVNSAEDGEVDSDDHETPYFEFDFPNPVFLPLIPQSVTAQADYDEALAAFQEAQEDLAEAIANYDALPSAENFYLRLAAQSTFDQAQEALEQAEIALSTAVKSDFSATDPVLAFPFGYDPDNPAAPSPIDAIFDQIAVLGTLQGLIDLTFPVQTMSSLVVLQSLTLQQLEELREEYNETAVDLLKRGQPSKKVKMGDDYESQIANTPGPGVTFASITAGLSGSDISGILSASGLSQAFNKFFEKIGFDAAKAAGIFVNTTLRESLSAATLAILLSSQIATDYFKNVDPNSSLTGLAGNVAILQTLKGAIENGEFVRSALAQIAIAGGSPNEQAIAEEIGGLSAAAVLSQALSALPDENTPNEAVLGNLALNLSFGIGGKQLSLRESVKSIRDTLGTEGITDFQKDLTDAFTDVLSSGGIAGDVSAALALRYSEGLFMADDAGAFFDEAIGTDNIGDALADQLAGVVNFSAFSPGLESNFFQVDPNSDLATTLGKGYLDIANREDLSNTRKIASLVGNLGLPRVQNAFADILEDSLKGSLMEQLTGEVGKSAAQQFTKEAMGSILSSINLLTDLLGDLSDRAGNDGRFSSLDLVLKPWKKGEKPSEFLSKLAEIPTAAALFSIYMEGLKSEGTNMKVGIPEAEGGKGYLQIPA